MQRQLKRFIVEWAGKSEIFANKNPGLLKNNPGFFENYL